MKRILFIEPAGSKANVFDAFMKLPLLGTLYLGTILHNAGYQVKIFNENISGRKVSIFELKADIVCLSCLTVNTLRAKELAGLIRLTYPQTKIIIGGIHSSLKPEDFTDVADHVVTGEAENIIIDLVEGRFTEKVVHGAPVEDLDTLPLINFTLLENYRNMNIIPIMTSRGCPFDCNFCTVTKIFGRKFREQSIERIIEEIKNIRKFLNADYIFFYDDNLTANKKRAVLLMDRIYAENFGLHFSAQVRADIARDDVLLEKMEKTGINRVFIGFESISDEVLASFRKSQKKSDIEYAIKRIRKHNIGIHGMFMFGEDHDTLDNIGNTVDFAINLGIDTVQFMILTPFPGTDIYESIRAQGRILHHNWNYYDAMHIVFEPLHMSPLELQKAMLAAYNKFYSLKRSILEILNLIFTVNLDAFLWNFTNVHKYGLMNIYFKLGAKYIINSFLNINKSYMDYLEALEVR